MGALTQFACTACGKTLKSPKPIAEGTKIKCPKCAQVFVVGNGVAPRRSGGDLGGAPPRRPTRAEKRQRSNPFVMWGTCFIISLIFSIIVWIPCRIAISVGQNAAAEVEKQRKEMEKNPFKDLDKMKDLDMKDLDKMKDLEKQMKDFGPPKDK